MGKIRSGFIYKIGDIVSGLQITDVKRVLNSRGDRLKSYKYKCLKCGFDCGEHYKNKELRKEHWVGEGNLKNNGGCACCSNKIVVKGINDVGTIEPWMVDYFLNKVESSMHTRGSNFKIETVCPTCNHVGKLTSISSILTNNGIACGCGDGIPYPEKLLLKLLISINLDFVYQPSIVDFDWCKKYKYDFHFKCNGEDYILETHGDQHYNDCTWCKSEDVQENDKIKKQLAIDNGIEEENYIVIDCRKSNLQFIKQNILNSKLSNIFNLSEIDWVNCEEFALSNRVKEACEIKRLNPDYSANKIGKIMKLSESTIRNYLKVGNELKWCNYDVCLEKSKASFKSKPINIIKDGIILNTHPSTLDVERNSLELYGVKLLRNGIFKVCNNISNSYKGYSFCYAEFNQA